jgi:hypothetical protein
LIRATIPGIALRRFVGGVGQHFPFFIPQPADSFDGAAMTIGSCGLTSTPPPCLMSSGACAGGRADDRGAAGHCFKNRQTEPFEREPNSHASHDA